MPINITPPPGLNAIGPGLVIGLQSNFVGPLPSGSFFNLSVFQHTTENVIWEENLPTTGTIVGLQLMTNQGQGATTVSAAAKTGDTTDVVAKLQETPSTVIDSGTVQLPWDGQSGLGQQAIALSSQQGSGTGGGLTDQQAQQLAETHQSTFPSNLLDALTLIPLTSGPTSGPVNSNLLDTVFGILVRIASVPSSLTPTTPDGDYWFHSLAVVRIFRGSDLWKRVPIHTSSKIVGLLDDNIVAAVTALTATQWLLNMTLQTTFAPGVTGQVFLMRFP